MVRTTRKLLSVEVSRTIVYLQAGLVSIIVVCGVVFLYNLSQTSAKGYEFRQQELEWHKRNELNYKLKVKSLEAQSFSELESSPLLQDMTKPEETDFVESRWKRYSERTEDSV